jgi:hypothetical protein
MTVCLSVKTGLSETVFTYNGSEPESWSASVRRVLTGPVIKHPTARLLFENSEYFLDAVYVRKLRDRMRYPEYYVEVEKVVQQVSSSQWSNLDFPHDGFKKAVQFVWTCCKANLTLESQILESLYQNGNGGLKVESILGRLLAVGVVARFAEVRDALGHLCKLYLVERAYGQFSVRDGMLQR